MMQLCAIGSRPLAPPRFGRVSGRGQRPRPALRAVRDDDRGQPQKKTIDELVGGQMFGTEPGGELGRQDPGHKAAGSGSSQELEVDAALRDTLCPLLAGVRASLAQHAEGEEVSPGAVAAAAVAATEASGALPPLAGPQRAAVEAFFSKMAGEMQGGVQGAEADASLEAFGSSGGEEGFGVEDAALRVRPQMRELLEEVINWHLGPGGGPRHSASPSDSAKSGGEVGNLALQSDTHHSAEPQGVPAQSRTDRAERQAEKQFEELELADLPQASAADLADQAEWEKHPENKAASAAIEGDAPAAGDGLQAVESEAEVRQLTGRNEISTAADQWKGNQGGL